MRPLQLLLLCVKVDSGEMVIQEYSTDETLTAITTPGQSKFRSNGNLGVLEILQISSSTMG